MNCNKIAIKTGTNKNWFIGADHSPLRGQIGKVSDDHHKQVDLMLHRTPESRPSADG